MLERLIRRKQRYTNIACTNCRSKHKKCIGNPCNFCKEQKLQCKFIKGAKRGPKKKIHKHQPEMIGKNLTDNYNTYLNSANIQQSLTYIDQNLFNNYNHHHILPNLTNVNGLYNFAQPNLVDINNHHHTQPNLLKIHNTHKSICGDRIWQNSQQMFREQIIYGDNPTYYYRKQDNLLMHDGSYSFESPTDKDF
ncbi:38022_t:CDS:1 [Gigaspora margarita]|uniref:38022_t:CDS:1 n=1 Tax=Gigaspora margarita TaxID=4874 RepID=A0ABN7V1Z7_GIGMA|nr:38022_t:CDS:1 [Gigaspora margarita]